MSFSKKIKNLFWSKSRDSDDKKSDLRTKGKSLKRNATRQIKSSIESNSDQGEIQKLNEHIETLQKELGNVHDKTLNLEKESALMTDELKAKEDQLGTALCMNAELESKLSESKPSSSSKNSPLSREFVKSILFPIILMMLLVLNLVLFLSLITQNQFTALTNQNLALKESLNATNKELQELRDMLKNVKNESSEEHGNSTGNLLHAKQRVNDQLKQAQAMLTDGHYEEALELYYITIGFAESSEHVGSGIIGILWNQVSLCWGGGLKRFDKAIQAIEKAIGFSPDEPVYFYNRAKYRNALNDRSGAISDMKHSFELDPNFSHSKEASEFLAELEANEHV